MFLHYKLLPPRKKGQLDLNIRPYADFQARLSVGNGLLLLDSRIVVPESMRRETLVKLHQGHQGIQRCRYRAKHSVWWPKISQDIENVVKQCPKCIKDTQYRREPLITSQLHGRKLEQTCFYTMAMRWTTFQGSQRW